MRLVGLLFVLVFVFAGCEKAEETCPIVWELDKNDLSSAAIVENGQLVLKARNATTPNSVVLTQETISGDFEASISIDEFAWDSLVEPQFRFEVYSIANPAEVGGVAINADVFYTYVQTTTNRDVRIVHSQTGVASIARVADSLFCSATIGGISLTYGDAWTEENLGIRLVLGTTQTSTQNTQIWLSGFALNAEGNTDVQSDNFTCRSF